MNRRSSLPNKELWGRQIRNEAESSGVTITRLMQISGYTRPTVIKAIRGQGKYETLEKLEEALCDAQKEKSTEA